MKLEEWKFSFEIAWDDPWYRWQSIATMSLAIIGSVWMLWKMLPDGISNYLLVFHYNQYFGIDEVHPWYFLLVYVGVFLLIVFADLVASFRLFRHDKMASRVLLCSATIFVCLLMVGAHFIISIH